MALPALDRADEATAVPRSGIGEPPPDGVATRRRRWKLVGPGIACIWIGLVLLAAITADWLPIAKPDKFGTDLLLRPGIRWHEPLGTDELGRSELSRVIFGARVSLVVGVGASLVALAGGMLIGVAAGYFKGWIGSLFDIATTSVLAFPPLVFLIALVTILQPSVTTLIVALGILALPVYARVARANTIAVASREFVVAARAIGSGHRRILRVELFPNVLLPMLSFAVGSAAALIVAEGSLSFLGLGVQPPTPSWGGMLASGRARLTTDPHLALVPGCVFSMTILSLNTAGDALRSFLGRTGAS